MHREITRRAIDRLHPNAAPASLFEAWPWVYAFCREHLFRDDTEQIIRSFWPGGAPSAGCHLIELGCGPGFYACRLAVQFGDLRVTGIDYAERQLQRARVRAAARGLHNCRFEQADVCALPQSAASIDHVVASRLFTVVREREQALAEMYRVLRPGGRCFIAEPRSAARAMMPFGVMRLLRSLSTVGQTHPLIYREPRRLTILSLGTFAALVESQPWQHIRRWHDGRYQYALCEKGDSCQHGYA
jgi:ubiquinone/menaquinone biosynthesis C-methylase UbiE